MIAELEKALVEIEKLSPQDQEEVLGVVRDMIEQRQQGSVLTDAQLAELRRRSTNPNRVLVPMDEAFLRLDRLWKDR